MFTGRTDTKAKAPMLWPNDVKSQLIEKDPDLGKIESRRKGQQRMRWLDGITNSMFEQTLGDSEGQGSLACCSPWGCIGHSLVTEQ